MHSVPAAVSVDNAIKPEDQRNGLWHR